MARLHLGNDAELVPVAALVARRGFGNGSTPEPLFGHGGVSVAGACSVLYLAHLVVDRGSQTWSKLVAEYPAWSGLDIGHERVVVHLLVAK